MADGPIHVFHGSTGAFHMTLPGHENGVWALVLVNTAKAPSASSSAPNVTTVPTSPDTGSRQSSARAAKTRASYRDNGQNRRASFNNLDAFNTSSPPTSSNANTPIARPSTVMGMADSLHGSVEGTEARAKPQQSDPCNSASGWGNNVPLIISGGCDRIVKLWNARTG
jgi:F-box and WD-40 domain protein CDC4